MARLRCRQVPALVDGPSGRGRSTYRNILSNLLPSSCNGTTSARRSVDKLGPACGDQAKVEKVGLQGRQHGVQVELLDIFQVAEPLVHELFKNSPLLAASGPAWSNQLLPALASTPPGIQLPLFS